MQEKQYKSSSITLNYLECPNNCTPLLLVHGNMERWQAFEHMINELAQQYHVYALDLRGHGKSSHAKGTYDIETYTKDVIAFIENVIAAPVIYFGFSLGGMIGMMTAATHPELISRLIIGDSPLTLETLEPLITSQAEMGRAMIQYLENAQYEEMLAVFQDKAFCESVRLCDIDVIDMTFFNYKAVMQGFDIEKLYPKITCPTLIIHGEQQLGSMISEDDLKKSRALLPSLQVVHIAGVGHDVLTEKEMVLKTIDRFIHQ